jgi:hypothetical protein
MKNQFLFTAILFFCSFQLSASHYVGGEVYWKCIPGTGKYIFYMDYYRDCSSNTANIGTGPVNLKIYNTPLPNNGTLNSMQLTFMPPEPGVPLGPNGGASVAPLCNGCANSQQPISCVTQDQGTLEKYSYRSQPITLTGKPPTNGWVFGYTAACCRSGDVKNLSSTGTSSMFKAIMYSDGRASQDPCYDSSPLFKEEPSVIICEGYDFQFNNGAFDAQFDSLSFQWADVVNSSSSTTNYVPQINSWAAGYSLNQPTPTAAMNPLNKSATINARTGNVNMFAILPANVPANKAGIYVTSTQVDAWRKDPTTGQRIKIATIFRDMPFNIFRCPSINFTFNDINGNPQNVNEVNKPPFVFLNSGREAKSIDTTIVLGDSLKFEYVVIDTNVSPCDTTLLTEVSIQPSGAQFDSSFTNPNGKCMQPPCATLSPAPAGLPKRLTGFATLSTQFNWRADCAHLMALGSSVQMDASRNFQFVFKVYDDFCPVPAVNYASLNVTVKLPEVPRPPKVYCFDTSSAGINFSYELMDYNANRFNSVSVYLGQRVKGSTSQFTFLPTPNQVISSYTGMGFIPSNQLSPTMEYAIKLTHRDSVCIWDEVSNYSSVVTSNESDTVQFNLNYKDSTLSLTNLLNGSIKWYKNGMLIANASGNAIVISDTGRYEVEVTIGGCVFRSQPYIITVVNSKELKTFVSELSIFPNPTTNQINIGGLSANELVKSIRVYNLKGELVTSNFNGNSIDLISFQNQLYLIRVETNKQVIIKKIMKQ